MGRNMENHQKWEKNNLRQYSVKINKNTERDVYEHMEKIQNKRAYIIELIRKDMKEG